MKTDLINANQLKGVLDSTSSTAEQYAKALEYTIEALSKQPRVTYEDASEQDITIANRTNSQYAYAPTNVISTGKVDFGTTLMALQCKSCGGVIDKDTMTCKHCGMAYMLVNSNEINPRGGSL